MSAIYCYYTEQDLYGFDVHKKFPCAKYFSVL